MKRKLGAFALLTAMLSAAVALTIAPGASAAPPSASLAPLAPITGTVGTLTYSVTPTITGFVRQAGGLAATGNLVGTVTDTATGVPVTTPINQTFTAPIIGAAAMGSCTILDLTLGPLHLNLLGLVVDLNQVHLTITGQTGPGNLLGNLLCGIANALSGGGGLGGLSNLLNNLLGLLGGLGL